MTPDDWLARMLETVDDIALRLSHTPHDLQEDWLRGFDLRMRRQWRSLFTQHLEPKDVDEMVADLVGRVRQRRDAIERFGAGSA